MEKSQFLVENSIAVTDGQQSPCCTTSFAVVQGNLSIFFQSLPEKIPAVSANYQLGTSAI